MQKSENISVQAINHVKDFVALTFFQGSADRNAFFLKFVCCDLLSEFKVIGGILFTCLTESLLPFRYSC